MRKARALSGRMAGFSMIELAVILFVLSLITINVVVTSQGYQKIGAQARTAKNIQKIRDALNVYYQAQGTVTTGGYLPCPANPNLHIADADFGKAKFLTSAGSGNCDTAAVFYNAGHNVVLGAVPARTLGLTTEDMMDGWGNRILYAVDKRFTAPFFLSCNAVTPDIWLLSNYKTSDSLATNETNYGYTHPMYTLISVGDDRVGAYPFDFPAGNYKRPTGLPVALNTYPQAINNGVDDNAATSGLTESWGEAAGGGGSNLNPIFIKPKDANLKDPVSGSPPVTPVKFDDVVYYDPAMAVDVGVSLSLPTVSVAPSLWLDGGDSGTFFSDAACTVGGVVDSGTVACWKDKSANLYTATQATAGNQPTFQQNTAQTLWDNGCLNTVHFTAASSKFFTLGTSALNYIPRTNAFTVFIAGYGNGTTGSDTATWLSRGYGAGATATLQYEFGKVAASSEYNLEYSDKTLNASVATKGYNSSITAPEITAYALSTTNLNTYQDGWQNTVGNIALTIGTSDASWDTVIGTKRTGAASGATNSLNDDIGEMLVYPAALSAADIKSVNCYLLNKWHAIPKDYARAIAASNATNPLALWLDATCPQQRVLDASNNLVLWKDLSGRHNDARPFRYSAVDNLLDHWASMFPVYNSAAFGGRGGFDFQQNVGSALGSSLVFDNSIQPTNDLSLFSIPNYTNNFEIFMVINMNPCGGGGSGLLIGKSEGLWDSPITTTHRQWELGVGGYVSTTGAKGCGNNKFCVWAGGQRVTAGYTAPNSNVVLYTELQVTSTTTASVTTRINDVVTNLIGSGGASGSISGVSATTDTTMPATIGSRPDLDGTMGIADVYTSCCSGPAAQIAEVLVFNMGTNTLTTQQSQYIQCYLARKWGVTLTNAASCP